MVNQIKWFKAHNTFQKQEHGLDIWVRGEPKHPLQMISTQKILMKMKGVIQVLGPIHKRILQNGVSYFQSI